MAKKPKDQESKNKSDVKIKKSCTEQSKKSADVQIKQGSHGKTKKKLKFCLILTSFVIASFAVATYKIYQSFTFVPDMPQLQLDEWWGPYNNRDVQDTSVRPFRVILTDAVEADLRERFENYRNFNKPKSFKDAGWTYGVNSEGFGQFFAYWIFQYKFSQWERTLNKFDHFKTKIQGLDIHFVHVKPKVKKNVKVLPLLLLHGWPGSFREFYEAISLLTTERPGRDFVFEVIVPSLPGFGYSEAAVRRGLSTTKIAVIMRNLMKRLGFDQYYVQGGDMGHLVASSMATVFPTEVIGFHTNMPVSVTTAPILVWALGGIWPALETFVEKNYTDRMYPLKEWRDFYIEESGYSHLQSTKPDTFGIALQESPAGLAAYILEKFVLATTREGKFTEDGGLEGAISKDAILDNIMIYWTSGCITTSMRLYKELVKSEVEKAIKLIPTEVPTWGLRLKYELFFMPEWVLKWKYPNLLGTTTLEEGGHFAALEKPQIFADDVFKAVGLFQEFHRKR